MRKLLFGLGLLMTVAVMTPRTADAYVSVAIGLPGFGLYVPAPPLVYAPPVSVYYAPPVYYRPPPPVYYRPAPIYSPPPGRIYYGPGYPYRPPNGWDDERD